MPIPRVAHAAAWYSLPLCLVATGAAAVTHHVDAGDLIGDALAVAVPGDSVVVACGTYAETGLALPDGVVLRSATGDPGCVTIATSGGVPILSCASAGHETRIEGFTFTVAAGGWTAPVARGAGLHCEASSPYVAHCRFVGLEADYGGAIYCASGSTPTIFACEFAANRARANGGALNCVGGAGPLVVSCLFAGNTTAIHAAGASRPRAVSCTFVDNGTALTGWDDSAPAIESSIIAAGVVPWYGDPGCVPAFSCSDIWGNVLDWTGLIADQAGSSGNFAANPVFCGDGAPGLPWGLDEASPCAPGGLGGCGLVGAYDVVCSGTVGVLEPPVDGPPPATGATRLRAVSPNPFNPGTEIAFELRRPGPVDVSVYDLSGRLVACLLAEAMPAGSHTLTWRGRDRHGRGVAAGVYLILLRADGIVDARRATLVK